MKRTITLRNNIVFYRGKAIDKMVMSIRSYFKLKNSKVYKYVVTIVEGTQFSIEIDEEYYSIFKEGIKSPQNYAGLVCQEHFDKLFFPFDENKKYDITVKKVRL